MRRIANGSQVASMPAIAAPVGTPGFGTDGDPVLGVLGTLWNADDFNILQEELVALVLGSGQALDNSGADLEQLLKAVLRLIGGKASNFPTGTYDLTADDMGYAIVSAVSGATVLNLPSAAAAGGKPMRLTLTRWEAAHSVTVNAAAGQELEYGSSITLAGGTTTTLVSDGVDSWVVLADVRRRKLLSGTGYLELPGGLLVQWGSFTTSAAADVWVAFPQAFETCFLPLVSHNSYNAPTVGSVGSNTFTDAGFWGVSYAGGSRTTADGRYAALGI